MGSLKPRKRLINFRLTQEEHDRLAAVCARRGAPSISDFARSAVLRAVELECRPEEAVNHRIAYLLERVARLEAGLRRLTRPAETDARSEERRRSARDAGATLA
jgi:hypothetical protein